GRSDDAKLSGKARSDDAFLPGSFNDVLPGTPMLFAASSNIFSTFTRIFAPRRVRTGGGPGAISGAFAFAAATSHSGSFLPAPTPGRSLISTPWWATTMMSCHVCAGREPPVMRFVDE